MFDKFGEFDSAEEINRAAAAQLKEGDLDAIKTIAVHNCRETRELLCRIIQRKYEETHTREEFEALIGRNYLERS